MSRKIPVTLAALAVLLAGVPFTAQAQTDGTGGKIAGMGISPPGVPQQAMGAELPRIRAAGINTAAVDVWWDVDAETKSQVRPGGITISDADLELAIRRAKEQGMRVILEPKVWCPDCPEHHWRGYLDPDDRETFFENYRAFVNHYAELADRTGVDIFFIGSEMSLVQNETEQWREVGRQARARYRGRLTYGVNWNVLSRVHFWDVVDIVSVSAYFPLSSEERPTLEELKSGWRSSLDAAWRGRRWFDEIVSLQRATRKKVFFGEVGYLSSTYVARTPYDETKAYATDQELQALAYQALLETFQDQSWWDGVVWWEWNLNRGDSRDTGYSPRNKLAEQFLKSWYVDGWRPVAGQATPRQPAPGPAPTAGARPATQPSRTRPSATAPQPAAAPAGTPDVAPAPPGPTTPANPQADAPGTTALGADPGLPTDEQAIDGGEGAASDRDLAVVFAVALLLIVLLPLSAFARSSRGRPEPFPAALPADAPPLHERELVGTRR